jgi:Tfp pilus assembly protein FimT
MSRIKKVMQDKTRTMNIKGFRRNRRIGGTTLAEVLVAISIVGVLGAVTAPNILATGAKPLPDSVNRMAGQLKLARAKAISQTSAYRVRMQALPAPLGEDANNFSLQLTVERAPSCSSTTWTVDRGFSEQDVTTNKRIELINGQTMVNGTSNSPLAATDWRLSNSEPVGICFNSRGLANKNVAMQFRYREGGSGKTQRLEIFPGGSIQIYDIQS